MSDSSTQTRTAAEPGPRIVVVALPSEIDITNERQVGEMLVRELRGASVLVADATRTTFCDCAGMGALTRAHHQASVAGVQFRVAASPEVRRVLALTDADQLLDTYLAVDAALSEAPGDPTSP